MLRNIFLVLLIGFFYNTYSQSFEGKIDFVKKSLTDTIYYSYLIKNNNMRVDELDNNMTAVQSLLIDLDTKKMIAVSPVRKMYMPFSVSTVKQQEKADFKVNETIETKDLFGYNCQKWIIENKKDSLSVEYWVAKDNFNFFISFLNISNTEDRSASYFLQFPNNFGVFPMLSVERDFFGKEELRLEVLNIEKKSLKSDLFTIPDDYVSFQR